MNFKILALLIGSLFLSNDPPQEGRQRWLFHSIVSDQTGALDLWMKHSVDISKDGNTYAFNELSVNTCSGLIQFLDDSQLDVTPAACTEACCETPQEEFVMSIFFNMKHYEFNGDTLTLRTMLKWPLHTRNEDGTKDSIIGNVEMTLIKSFD